MRERRVRISTGIWQVEQWLGWRRLLLPLPQFGEAIDKTTASQTRSSSSLRALPVHGRLACEAERACILCPESTLGDGRRPGLVWQCVAVIWWIFKSPAVLQTLRNQRTTGSGFSLGKKKSESQNRHLFPVFLMEKIEIREPPVMDISH